MTKNSNILPLAALISAMLIGGLGNTLLATNPQDPWLFLSLRYLFAAVILIHFTPKIFKLPKIIQLAALFEFFSVVTLVLGLSTVSVTLATVIAAAAPIVALAANKITGKQTVPKLIYIPILLGVASTFLIASQRPFTVDSILGIALVIVSILFGTAGSIINGWYGAEHSPWVRANLTNSIGAIVLLPLLIFNLATPTAVHPTWSMILPALLVALLPGTIAKAFNLYALKYITVPTVLQASTLSIVTASVTAWLILGQTLNIYSIVGIIIGIASVISLSIITLKQSKNETFAEKD